MKYRRVSPRIWLDKGFLSLDDRGKLFALYCLTSRQANRIGIFPFSMALAAEDLQWGQGNIVAPQVANVVFEVLGWEFDAEARVLWIPHWWRYNAPSNPSHLIGSLVDLSDVPTTPLIDRWRAYIHDLSPTMLDTWATRVGVVSDTGREGGGDIQQYQEQEQELYQEQKQKRAPSTPSEASDGRTPVPSGFAGAVLTNSEVDRLIQAVYAFTSEPADKATNGKYARWIRAVGKAGIERAVSACRAEELQGAKINNRAGYLYRSIQTILGEGST